MNPTQRPERQPTPALWQAGWYRFARRLRLAQLRPAARRRADRPDRAAFDQPAARPLRRRRGAAAVHQHARLGCAPLLRAHPRHAGVGALLRAARRRAVAVRRAATTAPGMPARRSWRGRANCNDDSIGIELEGLEGDTFEAAQYETLASLCAAIAQRYPIAPRRRPRAHRAGPQAGSGRGLRLGAAAAQHWAGPTACFPPAVVSSRIHRGRRWFAARCAALACRSNAATDVRSSNPAACRPKSRASRAVADRW